MNFVFKDRMRSTKGVELREGPEVGFKQAWVDVKEFLLTSSPRGTRKLTKSLILT